MLTQIKSLQLPRSESFNRALIYLQDAWKCHPFRLALCASLLIHILFLSFRWGIGEIQNRRLNTPLSVVLVNASNKTPPKQASKLAQADLQGGGKSETQDATALHRARLGAEARLEVLEKQQKQMLAKLDEQRAKSGGRKSGDDQRIAPQLNSLEAELAKRLQIDGREPRRKVLTGANTKSVSFAHYFDAMRQKIEAYGSTFFPRANGRPLYGSLVIVVSVDSQGRITSNAQGKDGVSIGRSSGNPELDRQALAIVRASAPFGPFPSEMRNQIDVLDWISTFDFTREGNDHLELKH
ncbi:MULTISPECIES: energy transducer TonB [Polynucleobacter]|uniref:energy transducer TonB family protein n=1 Tax=Polynucleobacter TaxID=44013 RepID=UPI0009EDEF13|nr:MULTISPECIES: TonB family protein [Polynucleobacter]MBU3553399.1 energy transducer TonB [Polynucleobacter sp. MWH-Post4-6-1]MBU3610146.1 energy transducer TonB [Polynucleobacter wuianus]